MNNLLCLKGYFSLLITCPAWGVLDREGKVVSDSEAGAHGLPSLEVARVPQVPGRAGLKSEVKREQGVGRRPGYLVPRRDGKRRSCENCPWP